MADRPLSLQVEAEQFPLKKPLRIQGHPVFASNVVTVTLESDGAIGRGEASGLHCARHIEALRARIEAGVDRRSLQQLLPHSAARNAVDCALWDLEAKLAGRAAWEMAGLDRPRPLLTTFTVSANTPEQMALDATNHTHACALKLELTGAAEDADCVRAVRAARPDVWLGVDAKQGFTRASLEALMPVLVAARVVLIEHPLPVGSEAELDGFDSPIYLAAGVQSICDLTELTGRFDVIHINLDACGGLTAGLALARCAAGLGFEVIVGNVLGTSLAMAPSILLGQLGAIADLNGPTLLEQDRASPVHYQKGQISSPAVLWGSGAKAPGE